VIPIRDFDDGERWLAESCLKERYGKIVRDSGIKLDVQ